MNVETPFHVVAMDWNITFYPCLAHRTRIELNLHHDKLNFFSLVFRLVIPHQTGGMKAREMLDWAVVEERYMHQSILCILHSKGSRNSWSQVEVVGSVTFSLGGHQAESDCSTGLETSKLSESWWRPDRWISRAEHDTENSWLTVAEA